MAYSIYITDALICGSRNRNTSDKSYLLFTRDAGMLSAIAKSARKEASKHRYALQDFAFIRVSLVHGKGGWRITGTEPARNLYFETADREEKMLIRNIVRVLRRFVHGESPVPQVFDDLEHMLRIAKGDAHLLGIILTTRILFALGYIDATAKTKTIVTSFTLEEAYQKVDTESANACKQAIEHALDISHL